MRNEDQRRRIAARIEALEAERDAALQALEEADDDIYYATDDRYRAMIFRLIDEKHFLEYPEPRNKWFRDFAESFETCKSRRISKKQADIFAKYGECHQGTTYGCRVNNRGYEMTYYARDAYLRITEF